MPFEKRGKKYYSPSGREFTAAQVRMYYATNGFKKAPRPRKKSGSS